MDAEDRRQQRRRRLGTQNPICVGCGESNPAVLERHHIAGRMYHDDVAILCRNCHAKASDNQRDHFAPGRMPAAGELEKVGYYLLGLAILFALIVEALRKFGAQLIAESKRKDDQGRGTSP